MWFSDEKFEKALPGDSPSANQGTPAVGEGSADVARHADDADSHRADVTALLQQMRAGDRGAAAVFVTRYGSRIRRRIRGKLSRAMRRIFDSQDILSTLGRRLDSFVHSGGVQATSEAAITMAAENAKARVPLQVIARSIDAPGAGANLRGQARHLKFGAKWHPVVPPVNEMEGRSAPCRSSV